MAARCVPLLLAFGAAAALVHVASSNGNGCAWTGQMGGPGGSAPCPAPLSGETCPVTPSYDQVSDIWPCPAYNQSSGGKYYGACSPGAGSNPLCTWFDPTSPQLGCCCPADGCWTPPYFNWIIGACRGSGCGAYYGVPATQQYKDAGTQLVVNYVATYQWNSSERVWGLVKDSSYNTDGSHPSYDVAKPNGGLSPGDAWLQPQPGGAADWTWGYYPAGVQGAGPPGMLFVLSTESVWNVAWYMLNQVTLDKGPSVSYPAAKCQYGSDNCWSSGNAGEIDFLEAPWTVNSGAADGYRRLYATQWNQVGRSFVGDMGATCNADGGWFDDVTSNNYFLGTKENETNPVIFAAVVDKIGTFIYRIPADQSEQIWPGLARSTAACTLGPAPSRRPSNAGPPCDDDSDPYCALFIPNCQADAWGGASAGHQGGANQGCKVNGEQGWCVNWWGLMEDTGQWVWPENGRRSVVQYQAPATSVEMPWNYEMEAWKVDWAGNPQYNAGCCVLNKGHCPT